MRNVAPIAAVLVLTVFESASGQTRDWKAAAGAVTLKIPENWTDVSARGYSLLIQEDNPSGDFPGSCHVRDAPPAQDRRQASQASYNYRAENMTVAQMVGPQANLEILRFANSEFIDGVQLVDLEFEADEGSLRLHRFIREFSVLSEGAIYEIAIVCSGPGPLHSDTRRDIEALMKSLTIDRE